MTDIYGLTVDATGDGGDSANFTSWRWWLVGQIVDATISPVIQFWTSEGPVRHPVQIPWNNPKNFTRDQSICLTKASTPERNRKYFWRLVKRGFFMPNTERDYPGSVKKLRPHEFFKDSKPVSKTFVKPFLFSELQFGPSGITLQPGAEIEERTIDGPEWAGLDFIGHLILMSKLWWLYPVVPFGFFWNVIAIVIHCLGYAKEPENNDSRQLYCMAHSYGLHKFFAYLHPRGLTEANRIYFIVDRNIPECHEAWLRYAKKEGIDR